jgi:uncharacterized tellurite resistance protein B-like protein
MNFSHGERLALTKTFDQLIIADQIVHNAEINYLDKLKELLDVDAVFLLKAKDLDDDLRIEILKDMTDNKKKYFMNLVVELVKSDGLLHINEAELINNLCESIGTYVESE